MGLRIAFETLGEVVEHYESHAHSVRTVETTAAPDDDALRVTLAVAVSLDSLLADAPGAGVPTEATLTDDGDIRLSLSPPPLPTPPSTPAAAVSVTDVSVEEGDDRPLLSLSLSIEPTDIDTSTATADEPTATTGALATADESSGSDTVGTADATEPSVDSGAESSPAPFEAIRDESVPAYDDVPYLRSLYEECANFGEMSRRIAMDVSSETVRRYMIEADIHQPASYDTASTDTEKADSPADTDAVESAADSDAVESPADTEDEVDSTDGGSVLAADRPATERLDRTSIATDGLGLPADVRLEDIADAVVGAATVHEVQRQLGLERERTRDLLAELNLIDLVSRRLVDSDRTVSYEQVADRLSQCSPSGA